jgi:hypothetical protein
MVASARSFASILIVPVICLLALPLLVTACTPVATEPVGPAPQEGAAIPPELHNIFTNAPYETSQPLTKQYPRVAFTVLSSPIDHSQTVEAQMSGSSQAASGCWALSATIWYKDVASRETGPFTVCMPAILSGTESMALSGYNNWALAGQSLSNINPSDPSTGSSRTNGPIPPDTPFPIGTRYAAYYGNTTGANGKYPDGASEEGRMWAAVLYKMGFYWQNTTDRRVWVYKYVPVEG